MRLLSKLVDTQHCADADVETLDDTLAFGRFVAGGGADADLATLANWDRWAKELRARPGFVAPKAVSGPAEGPLELFNDLYFPGIVVEDGVVHLQFPVIGAPRSSEGVATDYAFLLLAATYVQDYEKRTVVLEAWWPDGRVVRGIPECSTWNAMKFLTAERKRGRRITGPACHRCLARKDCRQFQALDEVFMLTPPDTRNPKAEAQRLWLEWLMLKDYGKREDVRRRAVAKRLMELQVNGEIDVNGLLKLRVDQQEHVVYDFGQVHDLLLAAGYWADRIASIKAGEMAKYVERLPPALRAQLARVAKTEKTEPSLREAAAGTARSVYDSQTSPFIGVC